MSIRERLLALDKQRTALALAVAKFESDRQAALAALPEQFGYKSLTDFIKELKAASGTVAGPRKAQGKAKRAVRRRARVVAASTPVEVPALPVPTSASVEVAPVAAVEPAPVVLVVETAPVASAEPPAAPVGTDLNAPRNFGLLPDMKLVEEAVSPGVGYYERLGAQLGFARKVLGTSGVPAAIWRQWRGFEQRAGDILRNRHQIPDSL